MRPVVYFPELAVRDVVVPAHLAATVANSRMDVLVAPRPASPLSGERADSEWTPPARASRRQGELCIPVLKS
jgi:hypothetical protein